MQSPPSTSGKLRKTAGQQVLQLAEYIIGTELPLPPEFFHATLPLCVIDAVFSIGVTYTATQNTVVRFCD